MPRTARAFRLSLLIVFVMSLIAMPGAVSGAPSGRASAPTKNYFVSWPKRAGSPQRRSSSVTSAATPRASACAAGRCRRHRRDRQLHRCPQRRDARLPAAALPAASRYSTPTSTSNVARDGSIISLRQQLRPRPCLPRSSRARPRLSAERIGQGGRQASSAPQAPSQAAAVEERRPAEPSARSPLRRNGISLVTHSRPSSSTSTCRAATYGPGAADRAVRARWRRTGGTCVSMRRPAPSWRAATTSATPTTRYNVFEIPTENPDENGPRPLVVEPGHRRVAQSAGTTLDGDAARRDYEHHRQQRPTRTPTSMPTITPDPGSEPRRPKAGTLSSCDFALDLTSPPSGLPRRRGDEPVLLEQRRPRRALPHGFNEVAGNFQTDNSGNGAARAATR